ncbi:alpha/beta hydrolase [Amaricoccus tamworthensis]|uniref:alpha/beta hydrolase n=1 Tax=Amaricoccus tamworthensis TaxID=57002 RepID=UPI003C7C4D4E
MENSYFDTPQGRRIAYRRSPGSGPGVVFLGGLRSDMTGTKAEFLEREITARGQAFLRFDYSGHGASSGTFEEGCIGEWAEDAFQAISTLTEGPQILVGSSMGGWMSLLMSKRLSTRIAGIVGIAAAPDFTEDSMWAWFSPEQKKQLIDAGRVEVPSDYSDEPYVITKHFIEEGRNNLVLREPLPLAYPVRLLHGTDDTDVDLSVALRIVDHAACEDLQLTLVKGADHRFSTDACLAMILEKVAEISALSG